MLCSWAQQEGTECSRGWLLAASRDPLGSSRHELSHPNGRGREDAELLPQGLHWLLPALLVVDVQDTAGIEPTPNRPGNQLGGQDLQLSGTNDTGGGSFDIHILLISFSKSPLYADAKPMCLMCPSNFLASPLLNSQGKLRHRRWWARKVTVSTNPRPELRFCNCWATETDVLKQGTAVSVVRVLLALNTRPSKAWKLLLPGTGELVLNVD